MVLLLLGIQNSDVRMGAPILQETVGTQSAMYVKSQSLPVSIMAQLSPREAPGAASSFLVPHLRHQHTCWMSPHGGSSSLLHPYISLRLPRGSHNRFAWLFYNSIRTRIYLEIGSDSTSPIGLALALLSDTSREPKLLPELLSDRLQMRGSHNPLLGLQLPAPSPSCYLYLIPAINRRCPPPLGSMNV